MADRDYSSLLSQTYSGIYAIPMVVTSSIQKNDLTKKLSTFMSETMLTYRLNYISKSIINPVGSKLATFLVGVIVGSLALKALDRKIFPDNKNKSKPVSSGFYKAYDINSSLFTEDALVKISNKDTVLLFPIIVESFAKLKEVSKQSFLQKIMPSSVKTIYEKVPTLIIEATEEKQFEDHIKNSNVMIVDSMLGGIEIRIKTEKSFIKLNTSINAIPTSSKTIDLSDLSMILRTLKKNV